MIIFSERVNGMYRDIRGAINDRNPQVVREILKEQVAGGADVIDINLGPTKGDPVENFVWLARVVHEASGKPISLDSAKPAVLLEAIPRVRKALPDAKLVINSSTAAEDNMARLIPLAVEHRSGIIGLTMDQEGVPGNVEKRVECGATFLMRAMESGLAPEDIYLDPIILHTSSSAYRT
jgi:cobalamin-dependent methionine synthase I